MTVASGIPVTALGICASIFIILFSVESYLQKGKDASKRYSKSPIQPTATWLYCDLDESKTQAKKELLYYWREPTSELKLFLHSGGRKVYHSGGIHSNGGGGEGLGLILSCPGETVNSTW